MSDTASIVLVLVVSVVVIGAALVARRRKGAQNTREWLLLYRRPLALTLSGALIALTGVGMFVHATLVSTETVDLAAAEAGEAIEAGYVVVEGYARPEPRLLDAAPIGALVCIDTVQSGSLTWVEAGTLCSGMGKRLCADAEWFEGCS